MKEEVLFSHGEVFVTRTRLAIPGQTFAVSGITSVKLSEETIVGTEPQESRTYIPMGLASIVLLIFGAQQGPALFSLSVALAALIILLGFKNYSAEQANIAEGKKHDVTNYSILLTTASGEHKALTSTDQKFVKGVVSALNDAIVQLS